jgi:hypothetical protein
MRPLSLFGVLIVAKILVVWDRELIWSVWTPLAFIWQDLLLVVLYAWLDRVAHHPWLSWTVYGLVVGYVAINVPIASVLSTPATLPMLRAAGGTLADSIFYYINGPNLFRVAAVLGVAIVLPTVLRNVRLPRPFRALIAVALLVLLGPVASARVDTEGLHRNPILALVTSALPRIAGAQHDNSWGVSPFGEEQSEDLTRLRGAARGRNVVIVHLESTGAQYLRSYGAVEDPMPNLTGLAARAILGENAYTVYPETIKSLVAVQSAIYPTLDIPTEQYEHLRGLSLATTLSRAGYRTGLFHSGRFRYLGMVEVLRNRGFDTLEDAGDIGGKHESSFGIDEESTLRRMLAWIDADRFRPFHLAYLPIAGHHPYGTPTAGPFPDDSLIGRYLNALHYGDQILGELVHALRARGLLERTLFVIFGDHGEAFGQHTGNFGHSMFIYEENIRVPYLVVAPGLVREPIRLRRVLRLVDTAPTVLDLLGLPRPENFQGRSILEPRHLLALFCTDYSQGLVGLRDEKWKFIHNLDNASSHLFDLQLDPQERMDLSAADPERVQAYRAYLLGWLSNQKYLLSQEFVNQ